MTTQNKRNRPGPTTLTGSTPTDSTTASVSHPTTAERRYEAARRMPPLSSGVVDPENIRPTTAMRISAGWDDETYRVAYARGHECGHARGWDDALRLVWKLFPALRADIERLERRRPWREVA